MFEGPAPGWQAGQVPTGMWLERYIADDYSTKYRLEGHRHFSALLDGKVVMTRFAAFDEVHARRIAAFTIGVALSDLISIEEEKCPDH